MMMGIDLDEYEKQVRADSSYDFLMDRLDLSEREIAIALMRLAFLDGVAYQQERERARMAAQ